MEKYLEKDNLVFLENGNFRRIGDLYSERECPQLPFSLCCDPVGTFALPEITGRGNARTLKWTDSKKSVEVCCRVEYDKDCAILSRRDTVRNLTKKSLTLRRYLAAFPFACGEYEVYTQRSLWCRESEGEWKSLLSGKLELSSRPGRWNEGATPFAVLRDPYCERALAFHVFPEGDWKISFACGTDGGGKFPHLIAEAGLADDRLELEIAPGETWSAPEVLVQILPQREAWSGTAAYNRYLNRRFPARPDHFPVVYNTWLDRMDALDESRLERQLAAAKRCGCEVFVVDYGWYEDLHRFTRYNDWDECTDRAFFGKMKKFADKVRKAGLGFGFWVEMEFFYDESKAVKQHPDWFFPSAHEHIVCPKTWLPEVEKYLVDSLAAAIRKYDAVYVKNDMNHSQGMEKSRLNKYQKGLFSVMAKLRRLLPQVTFENCSSGSLRMSGGGMMEAFDNHFISDNGSPTANMRMLQNMLPRFTPGRIYHWIVASEIHEENASFNPGIVIQPQTATWFRFDTQDLDFCMIENLMGAIGFSCDLASFSKKNQAKIASCTAFFKKYRRNILRAESYLLTPPEPYEKRRGWTAFQLSDPAADIHFLYVFHFVSDGDFTKSFRLKGLKKDVLYRVKEAFPEATDRGVASGEKLAQDGVECTFNFEQHEAMRGRLFVIEPSSSLHS